MPDWFFLAGVGILTSLLFGRGVVRRGRQTAAGKASGLAPVADLSHLPRSLQRTALWTLADGGFEQRVVHGELSRARGDIAITAFDLETLRERRGEWAWLPIEPPFRIGGVVSVVVCEVPRALPQVLFKHVGRGDDLQDDALVERSVHIAKIARDGLGLGRSYPAEMPEMPTAPLDVELPDGWRAYGRDRDRVAELLASGFAGALVRANRRDLVVELIDALVVIYPAAREVDGADAFADLTSTGLAIADDLLASTPALTPRGVVTH